MVRHEYQKNKIQKKSRFCNTKRIKLKGSNVLLIKLLDGSLFFFFFCNSKEKSKRRGGYRFHGQGTKTSLRMVKAY